MKYNIFIITSSLLVSQIYCDSGAVELTASEHVSHREGRDHSGGGGGVVSSGYGVPADSYSAGSSSYAAPSTGYGAPSTGYGAPSTGYGAPSAVGSSYAAPCDSYGCGAGGGAPVYVYQQGQGQQQTNSAGGALAALLPLGALALLVPLGILAFGSLFPTTTIVSGAGRKRRSAGFGNETEIEQQAMLLQNFMDTFSQLPELDLQKDMVAKYLECGSSQEYGSPSLHGCLQKLSCIVYDESIIISETERDVANIVLESILGNEFVTKDIKKRLIAAGKKGARFPGNCHFFKCNHHLLPQQPLL